VVLFPGVVLYADVTLGDRVVIHASSVIGADGFGYRFRNGRHEKLTHFGTVRVGNDVEIGACTTVDRAMIGETVIGEGSKLDNLVIIAHNCELGRHNIIVSQVGFAGSVTTGDYVVCAGQAGVADHVRLGQGSTIGAKTGVTSDVPAGETYLGIPGRPANEVKAAVIATRRVPALRKSVKQLEAQVALLTSQLESLVAADDTSSKSAA
jgi:UDP-3-O-[3-hydroxymyristoyl] glucosamine N-acyltransferase